MASKCRKFVPNMFNKSKCQACFGSKEGHSAEALESNKASRKVSKCGYLFVSPDLDFKNPLDRSRRWQRRFFRLYDDGELTFSVDENPDTVPQGSVDMNKCTDVRDADTDTGNANSIAVVTPEKTEYFKANSKEEIQWWHDILIEYPKNIKSSKPRRKNNFISNKENVQPSQDGKLDKEITKGKFEVENVRLVRGDFPATYRNIRSLKHKYERNYQDGMRKSSSLHDLSSEDKEMSNALASSRFLSCSGDRLDSLSGGRGSRQVGKLPASFYFSFPRTSWPPHARPPGSLYTAPTTPTTPIVQPLFNSTSSVSSNSSISSANRLNSVEERASLSMQKLTSISRERTQSQPQRQRSSSLKDVLTQLTLPRNTGSLENIDQVTSSAVGGHRNEMDDLSQSLSADETDSNETDELKMARNVSEYSSPSRIPSQPAASLPDSSSTKYEDLVYMKKGWLMKQGPNDKEPRKHWFVLAGNSLRYFKDAKAEENNMVDGRIDLSTCFEVSEVNTPRNYGLKIKTQNGEYILAAMTSGIRNNWMKTIRLCMDMHRLAPTFGLSASLTGKTLAGLTPRTMDDFELGGGAAGSMASVNTSSTTVITNSKGETAFQLAGRRESNKKDANSRNARRHHSDVSPGNVSKILSVKEFSANLDTIDPLSSSTSSTSSTSAQPISTDQESSEKSDISPRASKIPRHGSPGPATDSQSWSAGNPPLKRYVEGSDNVGVNTVSQAADNRRSKRNIASESSKEEEKREMMRRAKSPSIRIKEKSRAAKTPRLHSPPPEDDDGYEYAANTSQLYSDDDMDMSRHSEEHFDETDHGGLDCDVPDASSLPEEMLVDMLQSEVESLKERLDQTQNQLVKMHETNNDLRSRLQKESSQNLDSYSSGRWNQSSPQQIDPSQVQTMKRHLKDAKDTVQKQRVEIESLKSKLDMSASKLTGTEKALSEALKEYKQEKDKFLKLSSEWNRRIRTLEGQNKDAVSKLERVRESLQNKERECRRLELEVKSHQQKTREQDRELLKLKAVEHEYNQVKESLDNKERELFNAHSELRDKQSAYEKLKVDYEHQMNEMEQEFARERDDLENHIEDLKEQLCHTQDNHSSLQDNMTTNMADMLSEKDDIIAQLEEKIIENDHKMVDLNEEMQAEMKENAELIQNVDQLHEEKQNLQDQIEKMEKQIISLREKVTTFERENSSLKQYLEQLKQENNQLSARLSKGMPSVSQNDQGKEELQKTIQGLNKQIQSLQMKLMEKSKDLGNVKSNGQNDDLLHNILLLDSDLKEVNSLLVQLHARFDIFVSTLKDDDKKEASSLVEMVSELGHRCMILQETLHDSSRTMLPDAAGFDYRHEITVNVSSSSQAILQEYQSLKNKFDHTVSELKKLKKELNEANKSCSELKKKDKDLELHVEQLKNSYRDQVEGLVMRVDQLSNQLATHQSTQSLQSKLYSQPMKSDMSQEIEHQLNQLDNKISIIEEALAEKTASTNPKKFDPSNKMVSRLSLSPGDSQAIVSKLKEMKQQLESSNKELKDIVGEVRVSSVSDSEHLTSRIDVCGKKLDRLGSMIQAEKFVNPEGNPHLKASDCKTSNGCPDSDQRNASSMAKCMREIKERIQEIGEQLDNLEDEAESDDDEDGETTTVDDVRENIKNLCEYVEQHSKFSDYEWRLMQLLTAQKAIIERQKDASGWMKDKSREKLYADRLSLESLILIEMAQLLENKDLKNEDQDSVVKEISLINSKVLALHQKLDQETRTLSLEDKSTDVLAVQADLIAEKILMEGQVCCGSFIQSETDCEEQKMQPKLMAEEVILRSQLDSYIGQSMDKTCEELWSSASHLATRSLVQGELTFALSNLRKRLADSPHGRESLDSVRNFCFERLKERHKMVMEFAENYRQKMIGALAMIITKESEEMTIVEGPENVLEAVCSEVSTTMEKHIQHYKEKVRAARDSQSAHRWDLMVNQLRADRESLLAAIHQQHSNFMSDPNSEAYVEVPFQSLDTSINNFGEIMSLRSILCAHFTFVSELLKMGNSALVAEMEVEDDDDDMSSSDEDGSVNRALQKGLCTFMHKLIESLRAEAQSKRTQVDQLTAGAEQDQGSYDILRLPGSSTYNQILVREAVFAAQTTFMLFKMKLRHEQEMDSLKISRPARARPQMSADDTQDSESDVYNLLAPLEEVLDTKFDDETETLRVVASQVGKLQGALSSREWGQVEEHVRQLEQKLQDELGLAQQRHEVHLELFKQEEGKVDRAWEDLQQEREHYEERCLALETELKTMTSHHDDEVERMRQDVLTAVSAIRASEEESETQLSDKLQKLTKQLLLQKESFRRFLSKVKNHLSGSEKENLTALMDKELKEITEGSASAEVPEDDDESPPLPSQPPPDVVRSDDKSLNVEQELELLKKEKDEALAEEMKTTKAALDAMRKAYEEELMHERDKYKEVLTTMYNEDFVNEIRRRHEAEFERLKEELNQVSMHYTSKCEDYKLLEVKMGQIKQDYESHIQQLIKSNESLDDMVNKEIERLKDFIKNRPANRTSGSATIEEELYDAQIMIRVKDAELQKLRSQVKNLENSLHRTTEEHRATMTQYLQVFKENQEMRKEFQAEINNLRDQLDKAQNESGTRRPIRRTPSFHQRARSPSPQTSVLPQRRDSTSAAAEHVSRESSRHRRLDPKDLRRSKSSPSLPYVFDAKGMPLPVKGQGKGSRQTYIPKV